MAVTNVFPQIAINARVAVKSRGCDGSTGACSRLRYPCVWCYRWYRSRCDAEAVVAGWPGDGRRGAVRRSVDRLVIAVVVAGGGRRRRAGCHPPVRAGAPGLGDVVERAVHGVLTSVVPPGGARTHRAGRWCGASFDSRCSWSSASKCPALLTELAKALADRPRPVTALVYASSTSFPSGHALGTMVAVLALLVVGLPLVSSAWRWPLIGAGARRRRGGRGRPRRAQRAPSLRRGRGLGAGLRLVRRLCLLAAAAAAVTRSGRNTGSAAIVHLEARLVQRQFDLAVVGERGGAVDRREAELGHPQSRGTAGCAPVGPARATSRCGSVRTGDPVSRMRTSIRPSSIRLRRDGAKPDGR